MGGFGFNHLISICAGGLLFPPGRIFWQFEFCGISWEGLGRAGGFQFGFVVLILRSRRDRGWDGILFRVTWWYNMAFGRGRIWGGERKKILYVLYIHPVWSSGIGIKIKKYRRGTWELLSC